jgi:hypothetical protein
MWIIFALIDVVRGRIWLDPEHFLVFSRIVVATLDAIVAFAFFIAGFASPAFMLSHATGEQDLKPVLWNGVLVFLSRRQQIALGVVRALENDPCLIRYFQTPLLASHQLITFQIGHCPSLLLALGVVQARGIDQFQPRLLPFLQAKPRPVTPVCTVFCPFPFLFLPPALLVDATVQARVSG